MRRAHQMNKTAIATAATNGPNEFQSITGFPGSNRPALYHSPPITGAYPDCYRRSTMAADTVNWPGLSRTNYTSHILELPWRPTVGPYMAVP